MTLCSLQLSEPQISPLKKQSILTGLCKDEVIEIYREITWCTEVSLKMVAFCLYGAEVQDIKALPVHSRNPEPALLHGTALPGLLLVFGVWVNASLPFILYNLLTRQSSSHRSVMEAAIPSQEINPGE